MMSWSPSGGEDDPGIAAGGCVLGQPQPEVVLALWLVQVVERAHLGCVAGAAPDLVRAVGSELGVAGLAVPSRDEPRQHARRVAGVLGLAVESPWCTRVRWQPAEPDAAGLPPRDPHHAV